MARKKLEQSVREAHEIVEAVYALARLAKRYNVSGPSLVKTLRGAIKALEKEKSCTSS